MEKEFTYFIAINIVSFLLFGLDKFFAILKMRRIKEKTLILVSFLGGGVGSFLAMEIFRHKTLHAKFRILIPISLILTLMAIYYLFYN